jgi:D-amino-acid oxidase
MQVTVVGCGVAGLTTAVALRDGGHDAHITAAELPFETVSIVAGAIWSPSSVEPQSRVPAWALRSREVFAELAHDPAVGITPMVHVDLKRVEPAPFWGDDTPWVKRMAPADLPEGYEAAFVIDGFNIDPPLYLRWMIDRFEASGGTITLQHLESLSEVAGGVVVNCSGLGSRELVHDGSMFGIRGQTVAVANPGIVNGIADETDPGRIGYVYPRTTQLVLGGTRDVDNADPLPDSEIGERILADAAVLDPRTAGLDVIEHRVGFRPGRPEVRLEAEHLPDGRFVVHNYGHGGAGYIMSWGCAEEVAGLVNVAEASLATDL